MKNYLGTLLLFAAALTSHASVERDFIMHAVSEGGVSDLVEYSDYRLAIFTSKNRVFAQRNDTMQWEVLDRAAFEEGHSIHLESLLEELPQDNADYFLSIPMRKNPNGYLYEPNAYMGFNSQNVVTYGFSYNPNLSINPTNCKHSVTPSQIYNRHHIECNGDLTQFYGGADAAFASNLLQVVYWYRYSPTTGNSSYRNTIYPISTTRHQRLSFGYGKMLPGRMVISLEDIGYPQSQGYRDNRVGLTLDTMTGLPDSDVSSDPTSPGHEPILARLGDERAYRYHAFSARASADQEIGNGVFCYASFIDIHQAGNWNMDNEADIYFQGLLATDGFQHCIFVDGEAGLHIDSQATYNSMDEYFADKEPLAESLEQNKIRHFRALSRSKFHLYADTLNGQTIMFRRRTHNWVKIPLIPQNDEVFEKVSELIYKK